MSIATEITRIANAKTALKNAINAKGGTLTNELLGSYAAAVTALPSGTGSGATNFYKCASVGSGTWTGYKAVQNSTTKVWSFEQSLTSDTLTFDSEKKTPVSGKTYSADSLIEANLYLGWVAPEGAIFYEPFIADTNAAVTGQTYTKTGSLTFGMDSELGCNVAIFNGSSRLDFPFDMPLGSNPWSISVWLKNTVPAETADNDPVFGYADDDSSKFAGVLWCGVSTGSTTIGTLAGQGWGSWGSQSSAITLNTWTHYVFMYNGTTLSIYKNGTFTDSANKSLNTQSMSYATIGHYGAFTDEYNYKGCMSSFRIYNRALTSDEIAVLAAEFTPTV